MKSYSSPEGSLLSLAGVPLRLSLRLIYSGVVLAALLLTGSPAFSAAKPRLPAVPTALAATATSSSQVQLTWADKASNEDGYYVEYIKTADLTFNPSWARLALARNSTSYLVGGLAAGTGYSFRVLAYNIAGASASSIVTATTHAAAVQSCTYSISPTGASYASGGGSGSVSVSTTTGCSWTATSGATWITITSGASGTGNGTVGYSVAANTTTSTRSGTLTIAGKTFTVSQAAAAACSYTISPTSASVASGGGSGSVSVSTTTGCSWTASSSASWITITSGASGTGSGTVGYSVAANTSTSSRSGTLTIADLTFTVSQAGASAPSPSPGTLEWLATMPCASGSAQATSVASDRVGNIVVGISFSGTVDVGVGAISSFGGSAMMDGLVAKYNPQGDILWAMQLGNSGNDYVQSVALDAQGNIILAGRFQGTVDFGGGAVTSAGGSDIFVAKYSQDGTHIWSRSFGGAGNDIIEAGNTVAVDASGHVVLASKFVGTVNFGGVTLTSAGLSDVGLVKLSGTTGATFWARRFGGPDNDVARGIAIDNLGDLLVTGYFFGSVDLGGGPQAAAGGAGDTDVFVAKYSGADGAYLWGKRIGGAFGDLGAGIASDPNTGNIFVTGGFRGAVNFGGGLLDTYNNGGIFFVAYDPSGLYLWGTVTGSAGDLGLAVSADAKGNLGLTGKTASSVFFGGSQLLMGNGQPNLFAVGYAYSGSSLPTYRWSKVLGNGSDGVSQGSGLAFSPSGRLVVGGSFINTIDFGGVSDTTTSGYSAGFAAQYWQ